MNNLVTINGTDLEVKEFNGQRMVTMKDIDLVHSRPEGTAKRNFAVNKDKFIEGEDYLTLRGDALRYFKQSTNFVPSTCKELTVLSESGYLMLVKSFTDDLAWDVQRKLVNSYFRARQAMSYEDMIIMQAKSMQEFKVDVDHRFKVMNQKVDNQITLDHGMQRKVQKAIGKRVIDLLGKDTEEYKRYSKKYFAALHRDIKNRMGIPSYKDIKKKDYEAVVNYIQYWMPPANIKESA
ncbi:ORF6C domain-containing protein [Vallitalea guaymasensis]|uniref:ORF6C domain-containing protein n=1 Tax=Vallitalea guaymasensis TaxID=1185412 RepID=UPI000DE329F3|nr:ORF6C domain-containing protein [Vallitalea guaymasensis]